MEKSYSEDKIINGCKVFKVHGKIYDYQSKMINKNDIIGLLKLRVQDNQIVYLSSEYTSLSEYVRNDVIRKEVILSIIDSLENIYGEVDEYFLNKKGVVLDPSCIFVNSDKNSTKYCYLPINRSDMEVTGEAKELLQVLYKNIDQEDEEAIQMLHSWSILIKEEKGVDQIKQLDIKDNIDIDVNVLNNEGVTKKEVSKENLKYKQLFAMSPKNKFTFAILELFTFILGLLIVTQVLFSTPNSWVILFKGLFFAGLLTLSQIMIINKVLFKKTANEKINSKVEEKISQPKNNMEIGAEGENGIPVLITQKNKRIVIGSTPFIIGSQKNGISCSISNRLVSKIHGRIINDNGNYYLEDLNSKNGTYVNNNKINEAILLQNNSRITFANETFIFRFLEVVNEK